MSLSFTGGIVLYLHFKSNPLTNLKIFETVHSLIDSCQAHLPVQFASKIKFMPDVTLVL